MNADGEQILSHLHGVAAERAARRADLQLAGLVQAVKHFQHGRFEATYADILAQPRYARAARFFLEDLYGPSDFTRRDDQFARIVPALVRLFPRDIVLTVRSLAELHALSERLDTAMARGLIRAGVGVARDGEQQAAAAPSLSPDEYTMAWQSVGEPDARERQIELMLQVGRALDQYTRKPLLRHSLRLMRGPAEAAGLGTLQQFLETGFDTFREMRGADGFLATIAQRERALAAALFAGDAPSAFGPR
jgi:hypothetical protein